MSTEAGPSISWANRLLAWLRGRQVAARWPVLQVEVTSRCLMRCSFCPNKLLGAAWQHADLPWEVFRDHVGPHLGRFELIYLQGWGEPLLHRHLWDMVRLAKQAGCRVGFTSCGGLFTEENVARILAAGVDLLSVSFAGASAAVHQALRVGSDFERLAANVRRLTERRSGRREAHLHLELHYLMMRPNMAELPAFVRLAAELGADEVVATNLTYAFTPELDSLRVFGPSPDPARLALVAEAEREAERLGIKFRAHGLTASDAVLVCDAQPEETAFINCRGEVTPCVYLGMPVVAPAPRYFEGELHPLTPVSFGRVEDGFMAAWEGRPRRDFKAKFAARRSAGYSALLVSATGGDVGDLPAPPEPCQHCYKMFGV
ncbi:MAG: radical SAM/SPASM domain-containing protein [Anaerolineae bacterium]